MPWLSRISLLRNGLNPPSSATSPSRDQARLPDPGPNWLTRPTSYARPTIRSSDNSLTENLPIYADAVDPRFHWMAESSNASLWNWYDSDLELAVYRAQVSQAARIETLQNSLTNPRLSPKVRRVLQAALGEFVRSERSGQELLPPYSEDSRPAYSKEFGLERHGDACSDCVS